LNQTAAHGLVTEYKTGDRYNDQKHRSQRGDHIERYRGASTKRTVNKKAADGCFDDLPQILLLRSRNVSRFGLFQTASIWRPGGAGFRLKTL
jgi:hypothetical protein